MAKKINKVLLGTLIFIAIGISYFDEKSKKKESKSKLGMISVFLISLIVGSIIIYIYKISRKTYGGNLASEDIYNPIKTILY